MMRFVVMAAMLLGLTACFNNGAVRNQQVNWDQMASSAKVANVGGIKSLIRPGIY